MSVDLNKRMDMTCPVCEKSFHQTLAWLVKHSEVICPHCDSSYKVVISDPEEAEGIVAAAGSSFFTKIAGVTHRNKGGKSRQRLIAQCREAKSWSWSASRITPLIRMPSGSFE